MGTVSFPKTSHWAPPLWVRQVKGSILVAAVRPQITACVPYASCLEGEYLCPPQTCNHQQPLWRKDRSGEITKVDQTVSRRSWLEAEAPCQYLGDLQMCMRCTSDPLLPLQDEEGCQDCLLSWLCGSSRGCYQKRHLLCGSASDQPCQCPLCVCHWTGA